MLEQDFIPYDNLKHRLRNRNLAKIIELIALKYNIISKNTILGKVVNIPKMRQTKKFICRKCFEYFNINISQKQINCLLNPNKKEFPYTAIVIIETMYNLLKEEKDRWNDSWNKECLQYIENCLVDELKYEEFMLGELSEQISNKIDIFMNTIYEDIFLCFIDSRNSYKELFGEVTIKECIENFPIEQLTKKQIPQTMSAYQAGRVYLK